MDLQSLQSAYDCLPPGARQACAKVAAAVLGKALGAAWQAVAQKSPGAVFAGLYRQWREGVLESEADDEKVAAAFGEFFARRRTVEQLEKVLRDQYAEVSFPILQQELRESCQWAGCPVPTADLHVQLDQWVRDLETLLEATPQYRREFQVPLQNAVRELGQSEALVRNYSLALERYLASVVRQHRHIRFSGMAEVSGPTEVEMARIFVMPRVVEQPEFRDRSGREPKPVEAYKLLSEPNPAQRLVILGGPGTGKSTLVEALSLALAQGAEGPFTWARDLPPLLPIFCRIRDLDRDLERQCTIWDCLRHQCSRRMGLTLPVGFFPRQMESRGLMVLFDGLDEAASTASRNRIVELLEAFAESLSPGSRVLISSRPHDYRRRFEAAAYRHYDLCEFDDGEIQTFIQGWRLVHEPDRAAAIEKGERLWNTLRSRGDILPLARNALLLTMIVRVHFGLGALPDSRLSLYAKCSETLLKHWAEAKDLPPSPIDYHQKRRFLSQLAYEMQSEFGEQLGRKGALQISRADLGHRLERFLLEKGARDTLNLVDAIIDRLHARDAILVQYGGDQFGFVHRSFQEYFAAGWMAEELEGPDFQEILFSERAGWDETLHLAVAQLRDRQRRATLLELLKRGRAEFALACLRAAVPEEPWLRGLVQFLSRYTYAAVEHEGPLVTECAEACLGRPETMPLLRAMFAPEAREGQSLAAAVELAEELAVRGVKEAQSLLDAFFGEAAGCGLDSVAEMAWVDGFYLDRYLVTNKQYECMIPGHRMLRDQYSDADDQPVVGVNWHEARLFCRWRGAGFRLPTEEEWERAATWDPGRGVKRRYPWGDEFDKAKCNTREGEVGRTTPVAAYPEGVSAYGCYDMEGNVLEWTESRHSTEDKWRVFRGGAWLLDSENCTSPTRGSGPRQARLNLVGFRCAGT